LELRFSISPFKGSSGLISFRIDWLYLLAVQGTLKSLLQHYSSKASILQCSSFFIVQLSHPYMTTGKIIALMRRTFVGKLEVRISIYQLEGGDTKHLVFFFFFDHAKWHAGSQFPYQGWSPHLLQWKHSILTTGPTGNSQHLVLNTTLHTSARVFQHGKSEHSMPFNAFPLL